MFSSCTGLFLRQYNVPDDVLLLLNYPGELFMRLLKLLILPLIISSLIVGTSSINSSLSSKITSRTLAYFAVTSLLNAILGIILALLLQPGKTKVTANVPIRVTKRVNILDSVLDLGR